MKVGSKKRVLGKRKAEKSSALAVQRKIRRMSESDIIFAEYNVHFLLFLKSKSYSMVKRKGDACEYNDSLSSLALKLKYLQV